MQDINVFSTKIVSPEYFSRTTINSHYQLCISICIFSKFNINNLIGSNSNISKLLNISETDYVNITKSFNAQIFDGISCFKTKIDAQIFIDEYLTPNLVSIKLSN